MTIHAKITAYKGHIVCELVTDHSVEGELTTSLDRPDNFGQVIHNTKEHLGVSKEALELLKKVPRGPSSLGDLDWFGSNDGFQNFAWIGGPYALIIPEDCEASRDYRVSDAYTEIENEVPQGAIDAIDSED